ncbi:hypothetical protein NYO67_7365 [Aspergillus flavus]|nr:hypothetical protein NYO67_7365 [Aspergillus flavus]
MQQRWTLKPSSISYNTNTAQDSERFQRMLKGLDVAPVVEYIIRQNDSSGRSFPKTLLDFVEKLKRKSEADHKDIQIVASHRRSRRHLLNVPLAYCCQWIQVGRDTQKYGKGLRG